MVDQYLRGPRTIVNELDYDVNNEAQTVIVNGESMSVEEFRNRKPSKRKFRGMGILQDRKSKPLKEISHD